MYVLLVTVLEEDEDDEDPEDSPDEEAPDPEDPTFLTVEDDFFEAAIMLLRSLSRKLMRT